MLSDTFIKTDDRRIIMIVCYVAKWPCPYIYKYADNLKSAKIGLASCKKWEPKEIAKYFDVPLPEAREAKWEVRNYKIKSFINPKEVNNDTE